LELALMFAPPGHGAAVLPKVTAALNEVLNLPQPKETAIANSWQPFIKRALVLACKIAGLFLFSETAKLHPMLVSICDYVQTNLKNIFPYDSRVLAIFCHRFEVEFCAGNFTQADQALDQLMSAITVADAKGDLDASDVLAGFEAHGRCRLLYHRMRLTMLEESRRLARHEAARVQEATAVDRRDDDTSEAGAVRSEGDVNPFVLGLRLEDQARMFQLGKESVQRLSGPLKRSQDGLPLDWPILQKVLSWASETLRLLDHQPEAIEADQLSLIVASRLHPIYRLSPLASLLADGAILIDENIRQKTRTVLEQLGDASLPLDTTNLLVPTAMAWREYHAGHFPRAHRLCCLLLEACPPQGKSTMSSKILKAQLYQLLALIRLARGGESDLDGNDRDSKDSNKTKGHHFYGVLSVDAGPLEFVAEACRHSAVAVRGTESATWSMSSSPVYLRALRIHATTLATRARLHAAVRMPKEMRLYSKMQLEACQIGPCGPGGGPGWRIGQNFVVRYFIH